MSRSGNPQNAMQPSPVAGNVFQTSSNLFNQAAAGPNISQFANPYTSEVIGRTGMDMARQAEMQRNTLGAQATQAGAFGGSRHGVAEGTMMGDFGRSFGDIAAQQRQQGFNTALQAAQNQQNIQSGLAGQGFGFGQSIQQQQAAEGLQSQQMNQALIDAAKGQFGNFAGAPNQSVAQLIGALGGANMGQQSETTTNKPGLFNWLGLLGAI